MPGDIAVDSISDYQLGELNRLKSWLYRQRIKYRTENNRTERRREKEEAEAHLEAEQPVLFEF